jgi:hypothetical protein
VVVRYRALMLVPLVYTFAAYLAGALMGLAADRGGPRIRRDWPIYLRIQLLATSALLGLVSTWRLANPLQALAPVAITAVAVVVLIVSLTTRDRAPVGQAALDTWAAYPNGAFWVLPIAGAVAGTSASGVAAISNALYAVPNAVVIHLMRRDAPHPQRRSTNWVDQSALLALVGGGLLHLVGPAPAASRWVLIVSAPVLAFVGAALFTGSVLHPHNLEIGQSPDGIRRWLLLSTVRAGYLVPLAIATRSTSVAVVCVLSAFGAPAFNPVQLAVLYGYRSAVVNAAARWGWALLPVGLAMALALR